MTSKKNSKIEKITEFTIFDKKKFNDIEIKMLRENEKCYIKINPIFQKSIYKKISIMLNGEEHHWNLYNQDGKISNIIYFFKYV